MKKKIFITIAFILAGTGASAQNFPRVINSSSGPFVSQGQAEGCWSAIEAENNAEAIADSSCRGRAVRVTGWHYLRMACSTYAGGSVTASAYFKCANQGTVGN
jgi:hypothetical protein